MKIAVSVSPYQKNDSKLRGFADVQINDMLAIHGIQILEGERGLFVSMPQSSKVDPEDPEKRIYSDMVFPHTKEAREQLQEAILDTYFPEGPTYNVISDGASANTDISVRVTPYVQEGRKIRAMASVKIGDFTINNVTLLKGQYSLFSSYPSKPYTDRQTGEIKYKEVAEPIPRETTRNMVNGMLINEYKHVMDQELEKAMAQDKGGMGQTQKKTVKVKKQNLELAPDQGPEM